jgi:uncharacterized protein YcnI
MHHPSSSRSPHLPPGRSTVRRFTVAAGAALLLAALTAQAAQAHVRVHADSTESGSFSQLTFRVPNEEDGAGTVAVQVTLPQNTPFLYVSTKPIPGWTATVAEQPLPTPVTIEGTTVTKAPRTVTWQAQAGTRIEAGQYQDFDISAGPLPAAGTVLLPATQTYSDGTVVAWDQPSQAGAPEPEHPAPALVVTAAAVSPGTATETTTRTATGSATSAATSAPAGGPAVAAAVSDGSSASDPVARLLAGAALLVGLVALVAMAVAARRRRPTGAP